MIKNRGVSVKIMEFKEKSNCIKDSVYIDDGFTGKNFNRPAIQKLLTQAQTGQIQCIAVKDLSRFGRDYLEVGNYIMRIFPFLGIRFIAVNDGYDSIHPVEAGSLAVSFKTMLYDMYSRDLSCKVKSAMRCKAQQGAYISSFAPYGYVKDPEDKNRIVPDHDAAVNVRRMFQMAADGWPTVQIARALNEAQVLTPMQYKRMNGCSRTAWNCIGDGNFWTQEAVVRILRDERYTGKAVYGKKRRDQVGSLRQVQVKREDWVVVGHAHEGIISEEEFRRVQENLRLYLERGSSRRQNPLKRKVRCGVCGRAMIRCGRKNPYFTCHTPRVTDAYDCTPQRIPEADLLELVQKAVWKQLFCTVDLNRILEEKSRLKNIDQKDAGRRISDLKRALGRQENALQELYEKYVLGGLDREGYMAQKRAAAVESSRIKRQIEELEEKCRAESISKQGNPGQCLESSEIRALIPDVIKEIVIYPRMSLELVWNCCDEYAGMM